MFLFKSSDNILAEPKEDILKKRGD